MSHAIKVLSWAACKLLIFGQRILPRETLKFYSERRHLHQLALFLAIKVLYWKTRRCECFL